MCEFVRSSLAVPPCVRHHVRVGTLFRRVHNAAWWCLSPVTALIAAPGRCHPWPTSPRGRSSRRCLRRRRRSSVDASSCAATVPFRREWTSDVRCPVEATMLATSYITSFSLAAAARPRAPNETKLRTARRAKKRGRKRSKTRKVQTKLRICRVVPPTWHIRPRAAALPCKRRSDSSRPRG